jgi:DoxX-like family
VFGVQIMRPLAAGPRDLTNLLLGAFCGLALVHVRKSRLGGFFREPDVLQALRMAAGVGFVLAGLGTLFLKDLGVGFFVRAGYPPTFRMFITTAEVLGGVALLLPWRWLTLLAAAGLTVDMIGAIDTQVRVGESVVTLGPALAMLFRLTLVAAAALSGARRRWVWIGAGALVCAVVAVAGGRLLVRPPAATSQVVERLGSG